MEIWIIAGVVLGLIVLSGFFSGSETALTATSKARMHHLESSGDKRAETVNRLLVRKDRLIGALLIGNNLVNILGSALATSVFLAIFGQTGVAYATIAMTVLLVIFAEVLPKSWAISNPDRFALFVAPIISRFVLFFGPPSSLVNMIVRRILKTFGIDLTDAESMLTAHEEIRGAVEVLHQEGSVVKEERDRLGGLLDLAELEVSDIMVHRTSMRTVNGDQDPRAIVTEILKSPYTRMPVWRGENDNIVGIVHAKDLLRALHAVDNDPARIDIMKVATKPWFVPDTTTLRDQLDAFLRRKAHVAVVVDEYGEVEGLVTLEDIIEEIVGEIADEHDLDGRGRYPQETDGSLDRPRAR